MMRLLHWVLAPRSELPEFPKEWGKEPEISEDIPVGDAQFSVLYSDIGKVFYRTCGPDKSGDNGWLVDGAIETVYLPDESSLKWTGQESTWQWLTEKGANAIWTIDAKLMEKDLIGSASTTERPLFSFSPDRGVGAFSIQRTMHFTPDLTPTLPTTIFGVQLLQAEDAAEAPIFATWTLDVSAAPRTMIVTRIRATEALFPELLGKIIEAAQKDNIAKVEIWGLEDKWQRLADKAGWETHERSTHLSAYKWYGKESEDRVSWMFNERFCWC